MKKLFHTLISFVTGQNLFQMKYQNLTRFSNLSFYRTLIFVFSLGVFPMSLTSDFSLATNGMQPLGVGAKSKAMGGAGLALPQDALSAVNNPAALTEVGEQFQASLSLFNANRSYHSSSTLVKPTYETEESKNPVFLMPTLGRSYKLNNRSYWSWNMFPKGGGSVVYKNQATYSPIGGPAGVNSDGTGVWTSCNLEQAGMQALYSYKINDNISLGAGPVLGFQRFSATGLGYFGPLSSEPQNLTDNGHDYSVGYGASFGALALLSPKWALAAAYHTMWEMTPFNKYSGLIAQHGKINIPPQWLLGASYSPWSNWTFLLDYQVLEYSRVPSIANRNDSELVQRGDTDAKFKRILGTDSGPGFGWEDVKVIKLGAQYRWDQRLTVRAGYSKGNSPIGSEDVLFNVLAPAVTTTHWTLGATSKISDRISLDMSYVRTLPNTVTGQNPKNLLNDDLSLTMDQHDIEAGLTMTF